ncbi:MAG: sensor domain-containing diguanylate cyclase [Gammaproteobacteria bacterium]|nr:sensor domain-containing diguanylate cyclase [Gammaproteobacteria bacterium]
MTASDKETKALRQRLATQGAEATANELIFKRAHERQLSILEADSLLSLFEYLTTGLANSYGIPACTLVLCDPEHEIRHLLSALHDTSVPPGVLLVHRLSVFPQLYDSLQKPWLGPFNNAHRPVLPGGDIKSVAILPLAREHCLIGSINLGATDPQRFTADYATDILEHLGSIASFALENAVNRARLRLSGLTDALTGWHNRRYLEVRLTEEIARAQRSGQWISCLMIDIDRFKQVNDTYGHLAGDEVLREVALRIATQVRGSDVAARFGGEEFVVLLPDTEDRLARNLAERVRRVVRATPILIEADRALTITVSAGVAAARPQRHGDASAQGKALLEAADSAMYRAKKTGRDRVLSARSVSIANEID